MNKRPWSVTLIAVLFLAAGALGLARQAAELNTRGPFSFGPVWVCLVDLLAVIGAVFALRAGNWARWLLVAWIACHVILSAFHSAREFLIHFLLLALVAYCLFRRAASAYFRGMRAQPAPVNCARSGD